MRTIQEPKQERSIEKKNKILKAGFKLICEKGFHNTNTAEIAKEAGVSTGIVYRYFNDKKDIFLQAILKEAQPLFEMIFTELNKVNSRDDLKIILPEILNKSIDLHRFQANQFRELTAMSLMDDDFFIQTQEAEQRVCFIIEKTLIRLGYDKAFIKEKAYMVWTLADHLCDDYVTFDHKHTDFSFVFDQTTAFILQLLDA